MKTGFVTRTGVSLVAVIGAAVFFSGCGARGRSKPAGVEAATVPDADLLLHFDLAAVRETAMGRRMEELRDSRTGTDSPATAVDEKRKEIEAASGLTREDVSAVRLSANVANLDLAGEEGAARMAKANAVLGIGLLKSVTLDQIEAALRVLAAGRSDVTVSRTTLNEMPAVAVRSADPSEPAAYATLSADAKTVFLALNGSSLSAALSREREGRPAKVPDDLAGVAAAVPVGAQLRLLFRAPETLRAQIRDRIEETRARAQQDPGAGMTLGFLAPFQDLRSLAFGLRFEEDMAAVLATDLGNEQAAQQSAILIQTMILPMLQGALAEQAGASPARVAESLQVGSEGSSLRITLRITEEDLETPPAAVPQPAP